jgi:hypothetical protein
VTFTTRHLLHFFFLYQLYLPPVEVIISVSIVIISEYVLYREFGTVKPANFYGRWNRSFQCNLEIGEKKEERHEGYHFFHSFYIYCFCIYGLPLKRKE